MGQLIRRHGTATPRHAASAGRKRTHRGGFGVALFVLAAVGGTALVIVLDRYSAGIEY